MKINVRNPVTAISNKTKLHAIWAQTYSKTGLRSWMAMSTILSLKARNMTTSRILKATRGSSGEKCSEASLQVEIEVINHTPQNCDSA